MQFFHNLALAVLLIPTALAVAVPKGARQGDIIEDSYIVVLKDVAEEKITAHKTWAKELHARSLGKRDGKVRGVEHEYSLKGLKGYAGTFDKETIDAISTSEDVAYVEVDRVMSASALVSFSPILQDSEFWDMKLIGFPTDHPGRFPLGLEPYLALGYWCHQLHL